jgi:hypothetical protein
MKSKTKHVAWIPVYIGSHLFRSEFKMYSSKIYVIRNSKGGEIIESTDNIVVIDYNYSEPYLEPTPDDDLIRSLIYCVVYKKINLNLNLNDMDLLKKALLKKKIKFMK